MKKWLSMICIIALVLTMLPAYALLANAADESGKCGDNLTWQQNGSKITISGTGAMYDYSEENPAPWSSISTMIFDLIIEEGVTTIGNYAFAQISCSKVVLPKSIESIGAMAFGNMFNDELFFMGAEPKIAADAFGNANVRLYTIQWPEEVKQNYGGNIRWVTPEMSLDLDNSKQLVGLNETLKLEDFAFRIKYSAYNEYLDYIPRSFIISSYNTTAYGEQNVTVTADGYTFDYTFFVTDGSNHLDLIRVEFPESTEFPEKVMWSSPIVSMGTMVLTKNVHYTVSNKSNELENFGGLLVKGKGIAEGFEKTFYFPILKQDISANEVNLDNRQFTGEPVVGRINVGRYDEGVDYQVFYENNINLGTATARIVGIGECYGEITTTFQVTAEGRRIPLHGKCIGTVDGDLNEDYVVNQMVSAPCVVKFNVAYEKIHVAAYALYRVDEEEVTLIEEYVSEVDFWPDTCFVYDFSSVYEDAKNVGGQVYMLSYSWVTADNEVYAGVMVIGVLAKVGAATSMTLHHVENDGDFRKEYFSVSGDDGVVGEVIWTSSDTSVAVVEGGTVTMKKPGTVLITAQCGDMIQSYELTETTQDLTQGIIFDYSEETGTARVIHDGRVLTEGTEYILSVEKNEGAVTVTATGCGFFTGELVKTFEDLDSLADPHTHSFTNSCDGTCNGCEFTRENDHNFSQGWSKDQTHHWHACLTCGEKTEYSQHDLLSEEACSVCGILCSPGDLNGDDKINSLDGLMLMRYLNGWNVEIAFPDAMDVNGDGKVNSLDGLILMRYLNGWNVSIG